MRFLPRLIQFPVRYSDSFSLQNLPVSKKWFVILVAVAFAVGGVLVLTKSALFPSDETDEELIERFFTHRAEFDQLANLLLDDHSLRFVSRDTFHRLRDGKGIDSVPSENIQHLFDVTGVRTGIRDGVLDITYLAFPTSITPLATGEESLERLSEKHGYAYLTISDKVAGEIFGSKAGSKIVYGNADFTRIDGRWFIFRAVSVSKPE